MKASNINVCSHSEEKPSSRTLTLKKPLGVIQEAKLKSCLGETIQKKNPSSLNNDYVKLSQQYRLKEALELLRYLYPQSFTREILKPLKIGIDKDIIKKGLWPYSVRFLRKVLSFYTNSIEYQQKLIEGKCRYSLEGFPVESILEHHKEKARNNLQLQQQRQSSSSSKPLEPTKAWRPSLNKEVQS